MSILIDEKTRLLIQGITGSEGSFHTQRCIEYGTKVVAGVTPGKGGSEVSGVAVFNTVGEAVKKTGANASMVFVHSTGRVYYRRYPGLRYGNGACLPQR